MQQGGLALFLLGGGRRCLRWGWVGRYTDLGSLRSAGQLDRQRRSGVSTVVPVGGAGQSTNRCGGSAIKLWQGAFRHAQCAMHSLGSCLKFLATEFDDGIIIVMDPSSRVTKWHLPWPGNCPHRAPKPLTQPYNARMQRSILLQFFQCPCVAEGVFERATAISTWCGWEAAVRPRLAGSYAVWLCGCVNVRACLNLHCYVGACSLYHSPLSSLSPVTPNVHQHLDERGSAPVT